ncbi:Leucine-rich repeat protein SHOC-2 [Phytophthora citrophthora]|uniref:Leucine-rich repeat protein SHOC-2 n=1 Tax=Phytophthora citrophthora TaxID=4793 RepID=A0AAD9GSM4_9STRA|nr:Leucine-rich repeat protein SHOC-2 [Phytophthora citrophthora]
MHPWLAPNLSCAVIKYNCYKEGVVSPPHDVFQWSEREVVRKITFLHCSAFQMPPSIREFQSLMGIELWNVTLVQWGEEAGVSAELHPNMLFLFFSFVNMTEIPAGILSPELPELLTDLEFAHTNLTSLPQAIIKSWKSVEVLYVEHSQLGQFPTIVMQLPALSELSLIDNKFNAIPEEAFSSAASTNYYDLALSHNAIRHLPSKVSFCIFNLALEFTQLEEIPGWIKENVWVSLSLRGSSVCDPSTNIQIPTAAHCERIDPLGEERFPTKIVEPFRALNA